jgi:hypothetical protein
MSIQSIEALATNGTLSFDVAEKYLTIYLGEADWKEKIGQLWTVQKRKIGDEQQAKEFIKKSVACACLSPIINKAPIPEEKHVMLFWVAGWPQFNERDWFDMLRAIAKKDLEVENNRKIVLQSGIFNQIDVSPLTRQAFNWIYERTDKEQFSTEEKKQEALEKIKNLVKIYGGAIICNVFTNYPLNIEKVLNWRSGYFIEKEIYKVYSLDQILKIKKAELNKTNPKYITNIK